jgi:SAM-dependent methyltransferase
VVTGIDIGEGVIEAAKRLGPGITFQVGDAEALEFDDATFDGVTSTFGVMFVARPAAAAGEIARIIRRGGRLALATWLPGGPVEELFKLTRTFAPSPPAEPPPSPFEWSHEERARELLGGAFDLIMWQHLRRSSSRASDL